MNLVYYNPLALYFDFKNELNFYKKIQSLVNPAISLYDRTGTIPAPVNVLNQYPLPQGVINKTFAEICQERINFILSTGKEIGILFSGGIDSTLVMVLLLQNMKESDRERITIFYNDSSILENRIFFEKFIKNKFKHGNSWHFDSWLNDERIIVTGECADNLFGSLTVKFLIQSSSDSDLINKPYRNFVEFIWKKKLENDFDLIYDYFIALAKKAPYKLVTIHDWFWWINFTMKWQAVIYRIPSHCNLSLVKDRIVHFFNTEDFQLWSLNNPQLKVKDDWNSYKWLMKEQIFEFDKNEDYFLNKVKFPSLPSMVRFKNVNDYISDQYTSLTSRDIILCK